MSRRARILSDLGESALIDRIARRAGHDSKADWPLGIGDDAAILRPRAGSDLVLSVDAQVEDVHFRFGRETPLTIGRRALVVNLSDLAAMGATPVGSLLSLAVPASLPLDIFDGLVKGLVAEAKRYDCPLVGGNLTRAEKCSLHVTVVGRIARGRALRRGTMHCGDQIYVTGTLGAATLARRRAHELGIPLTRVPTPRLVAGQRLARSKTTTGCIDLSDGLSTDLAHLIAGSGAGAEIDVAALPAPRGFHRACTAVGLDAVEAMLRGGEDYELLFVRNGKARRSDTERLAKLLGVRVSRIGQIVDRPGIHGLPAGQTPEHHF